MLSAEAMDSNNDENEPQTSDEVEAQPPREQPAPQMKLRDLRPEKDPMGAARDVVPNE